MNYPSLQTDPKKAILSARIIWGAMLMSQLIFMGVVLSLTGTHEPMANEDVQLFYIIASMMAVGSIGAGLFVRMQIYKKHWENDCVTPAGYLSGTLIAMACIEGPSLFSMVVILLHGVIGINIVLPAILLGIFIVNFPNGRPMQSSVPDFARKPMDTSK